MKESSISREHAFQILTEVGIEDIYDPMNDYYVVTTDDGVEMLVVGGIVRIIDGQATWYIAETDWDKALEYFQGRAWLTGSCFDGSDPYQELCDHTSHQAEEPGSPLALAWYGEES